MTTTFADLGLSTGTLAALAAKGFEEPTEIQAKAIPVLLQSAQDIIAQAQTGTGKTATFGLVFTDKLTAAKQKSPQAIVLAPTRELAVQIAEELNSLRGEKRLSIVPIYGGQSWGLQTKHLRNGVDIVVGTPGRVMEHLQKGTLKLDKVEYFVLDEADEMLNMGFIEDIEAILEFVQPDRQVLLFSATMPKRIEDLAQKYLRDPVNIRTQKDKIANNAVDQIYFEVFQRDKFEALCRIVDMEDDFYGIIFCRTKIDADEVSRHLNDRGYKTEACHGDVTQDRREKILRDFRGKKLEILVATDVAARGIDVKDLTHVINYSLPQNSESYVHRIGRTGRAGKAGKAITLITPAEYRKLRQFEHHAKAELQKQTIPDGNTMVELRKERIKQELELIIDQSEVLSKYEALAQEMFGHLEPQQVIAALLKQKHENTLNRSAYKDIAETSKGQSPRKFSDRREGGTRDRRDRKRGDSKPDRFGNTRLFLTTGYKDGAHPVKILKTIEQETGVSGKSIGDIDIMDSYSFISVPLAEAEKILDAFQSKRGGGSGLRVERADQDKGQGGFPKGKNRGKKSFGDGKKFGGKPPRR